MKVLTVGHRSSFRQQIHQMLRKQGGVVPAEVGTTEEALHYLETRRVDVMVLEHNVAGGNGIDTMPLLFELQPDLQIIVMSACSDDEILLRAIRHGACGYMCRDAPPERVIEAIKAAAQGECRVSEAFIRTLFERVGRTDCEHRANGAGHGPLSAREQAILVHLVKGFSNKEIARELGISPNTVRNQLQRLQGRFSARNRVQLALVARDMGIG